MNPKHLLILLAAAVILGAAYFLVNSRGAKSNVPAEVGLHVLAGVDVNAVTSLEIADANNTLEITRDTNGVWRVPSLANYPADFDRLAQRLRNLADVKIADVLRGMTLEPATTISLRGNSVPLATLHLGQVRQRGASGMMWQPPEGRYLRVGDDEKIVLVKEDLGEFTADPRAWVDTQLLAIPASEVYAIEKSSARFDRSSGTLVMENLAEGETFDTSKIYALESAFSNLRFVGVLPESTPDTITGLSTGVIFRVSTINNGSRFSACIGNATADGNRYAKFTTEEWGGTDHYVDDENPGGHFYLETENDKFSPYIFTIPAHIAETMTRPRDYFLKELGVRSEELGIEEGEQ